ncbi:hypothetical protein AMELA_G00220300 [Ameiurus melas]|uniref:C-type lectin domain-containing protein n=1 Tax=Ameiurus melas TaxID=219545 RepID=A0A7J6A408_AMEME|nr:hypothetical protein AMELA_G00220300 [Ameiurus melas]
MKPVHAFSPPVHSRLSTFHIIQSDMNQTEARAACRENYTDLVTVYSDEDSTELYNMTMTYGYWSWIGLYRSVFSEKWSNGDPVTFRNLTGDCGTSSYCAAVKTDGSWESVQCTETRYFKCYEEASIHVSDEALSWEKALDYCHEGNRAGILHIDSESEQEELESELRRRRVPPGNLWVGLGPNRLSEMKVSSGPLTCEDVERQTAPPLSHCAADTHTAEAAPDYVMDSAELRVVCKLK